MKYSRRQFLGITAAGMGATMLSGCASWAGNHDPYELVELGKTGIKTTRLCMGTGIKGGNRQSNLTRLGYEQAVKLVRDIYERGVRMFDLAEDYGTHACVGEALKIYPRKDYVIVSKMAPGRRRQNDEGEIPGTETESRVLGFLEDLQTDYIDVLQLHGWSFSGNWNTEHSEYMSAMVKLKEKGIIRAHGLSSHSTDCIETAIKEPWVDAMHVRFNAYGVSMDDATEKVAPLVKQLHERGKAVIAMKVYGEGAFSNSEELRDGSLRYVLQSGIVDILTIGMDKISDITDTESRIRKVPR
jgi:aryl-alcohol dehydrogenase-like predicted oxidoreductase